MVLPGWRVMRSVHPGIFSDILSTYADASFSQMGKCHRSMLHGKKSDEFGDHPRFTVASLWAPGLHL